MTKFKILGELSLNIDTFVYFHIISVCTLNCVFLGSSVSFILAQSSTNIFLLI